MKCVEKKIKVNFDDYKSIISSQKKKSRLEDEGYKLKKTSQIGFSKFLLIFRRC